MPSTPRISMLRLAFVALAALSLSISVRAQEEANVTVTSIVPQVLNLAVQNTSVAIPFAASDYNNTTGEATKTVSGVTSVSIASNRAWTLSVRALSEEFTFTPSSGDANPRKPAGDLSMKVSNLATFFPLTTTNTALTSGSSGGSNESGNQFTLDYSMKSNLKNDPPGTYSIGLILTLASP